MKIFDKSFNLQIKFLTSGSDFKYSYIMILQVTTFTGRIGRQEQLNESAKATLTTERSYWRM